MARKTVKITIRRNARSKKYGVLFGYTKLATGWRVDLPWISISVFGGTKAKRFGKVTISPTRRTKASGLRVIWENNRRRTTRITHDISKVRKAA